MFNKIYLKNFRLLRIAKSRIFGFLLTKYEDMNMEQMAEQNRQLQLRIAILENENAALAAKQKAFQDALISEVQRIEKLGWWKKFLNYAALLKQLVESIYKAIEENKK